MDPEYVYLLSVIPYFLPSFVAAARGHRKSGTIFLLNLVLGWTVLGWIAALVWAARIAPERRKYPRFAVPPDMPLRCVVNCAGVTPFEAQIVDVSRGGIGGMVYEAGVSLPPGTLLRGCSLIVPGGAAIGVDLEVRKTRSIVQPGGSVAQRSGVRFLDEPKGIDALLARLDLQAGEARGAG